MFVKNIELKNFRNYKKLELDFNKNLNIIIGRNAQGKTNLIEAVFLSSLGRSFRTSHDAEMISFGAENLFVSVNAEKELTETKVEINIGQNKKKFIKKDGNIVRKTSELMSNIIIVIFSPEDLKIVKEEPEKRRKFIDRELSQIKPAYYSALSNYKRALLQRNNYLKQEKIDINLLKLWDEQLIENGSKVIFMRKDFIDLINIYSGKIHHNITNGLENLNIKYDPNIRYADNIEELKKLYRDKFDDSRNNDLRLRTTTIGPHKDDIKFFVNGIDARSYGSQGQQRTCALSLKLAELDFIKNETGETGILLLDDVMSELDEIRRNYLVSSLHENQLFITTTEVDNKILNFHPDAKVFEIDNGTVNINSILG